MKIAWLYKDDSDDTEWKISFDEPPRWARDIRQIAYVELGTGAPT